jgi:hypothetical protein
MLVIRGTSLAEDSASDGKDLMSYQRSLMILWMLAMAAFVAALAGCTSLTMGSDYDRAAVFSNCHRPRLWADARVGVRAGTFESVSATRSFRLCGPEQSGSSAEGAVGGNGKLSICAAQRVSFSLGERSTT